MIDYANLSGHSNVISYEYGYDYIEVMFSDYSMYRYTYHSAGKANIENMKACADRGYGLNGYINRYCKYRYESKS